MDVTGPQKLDTTESAISLLISYWISNSHNEGSRNLAHKELMLNHMGSNKVHLQKIRQLYHKHSYTTNTINPVLKKKKSCRNILFPKHTKVAACRFPELISLEHAYGHIYYTTNNAHINMH